MLKYYFKICLWLYLDLYYYLLITYLLLIKFPFIFNRLSQKFKNQNRVISFLSEPKDSRDSLDTLQMSEYLKLLIQTIHVHVTLHLNLNGNFESSFHANALIDNPKCSISNHLHKSISSLHKCLLVHLPIVVIIKELASSVQVLLITLGFWNAALLNYHCCH